MQRSTKSTVIVAALALAAFVTSFTATTAGLPTVALGNSVGETLLRRGADKILEDVYGEAAAAPQQP